ncbi:hypothetical protein MATR_27930 [Marivirga tractuosa]|uniref:PKD domain containing protein n=1 Tax=Marivirga tractuosa (strain ATCC 23168 / DSM 4126 / NBRC 15989 / NCIMB 1408 / VKM B-1430 / H-43) TaxID=643867 RepID=E4TLS9_MARTH|nr:choice-of-anchor B family protein [Marivirga tractuosa]ADR23358.1 PKD domain containing protein [Marivirga tractuosa DSM 4126]BDD15968.1 hypothetical protein MATR_27930 [Marivirga tractuosa]
MTKNYLFLLVFILTINFAFSQTACENGTVNGFDCNQVDFYANINNSNLSGSSGVAGADIWGWTDPQSGIEYALMCQTNGVVFVSIENPSDPIIIGRLESQTGNASSWRDIKVYNDHAFVVADNNSGHGMQVFDLKRLRDYSGSILDFNADAVYNGVSSAHNVVINEASGFAYIVGARGASNNCGAGGLHIVDIRDPKNPKYAGCFDADGYTHDAQCVIYNGPDSDYQGQEICFNANENTVTIANVENKGNTSLIAKSGFPQSAYSHQGWLTEDHQYFISNDELDEQGNGFNTRTLIWDVRDLDNPVLINQHYSEKSSIDHNLYIKNNKIYQSNYTSGLVILDANKVNEGEIRERAFFDTYPNSNNNSFNGSWSNFPFFESGVVVVSDINNGLFVLQPNLKEYIDSHPIFEGCGIDNTLSVGITEGLDVQSYQWQLIQDGGSINIQNSNNFSGVNTAELTINLEQEGVEEMKFRCKVVFENGEIAYSYNSNSNSGVPSASFNAELNNLEVSFVNYTSAADSFEWDFGDGSEISTEENPVHIYDEVGTYEVVLTVSNDCGTDSYNYAVDLSACIPAADFSYHTEDGQFNFYSSSDPANEFEWDFGDGSPISTEINPSHTYAEEDNYTVTLVVRNECGESTYSETLDVEKILSNDKELRKEFKVFPNPFQNNLNVKNLNINALERLEIIDQGGRKLIDIKHFSDTSDLSFRTDYWNKGMYYLVITKKNGQREVSKILKH